MKSLSAFNDETTLHGFGFIAKSRTIVERVCWSLFILVCIALTIKDTVMLIQLYLSEPTAVTITMTYDEQARRFPNASACIEIDRCLIVTLVNMSTFSEAFQAFSTSGQPAILNSGNITAAQNASIDRSIIVATYLLLAEMMDFDNDRQITGPCLVTSYHTNSFQGTVNFTYVNYSNAVEHMFQFYTAATNNFDLFTLKSTISGLICKMAKLSLVYSTLNVTASSKATVETLDLCGDITWFGPPPYNTGPFDYLCANIAAVKPALFENPTDSMIIQSNLVALRDAGLPFSFNDVIGSNDLSPATYFDVNGGEGVLDYKTPQETFVQTAVVANELENNFNVRVDSIYTAQNLSRQPCVASSQFECRQACISQMIASQRGCWPLNQAAYKPAANEALACTGRFAYNALGNVTSVSPFNQSIWSACESACSLPPCTTNGYTFFVRQKSSMQKGYIYPSGVVYMKIDEIVTMDMMALFVQFGGSIGLWLGGSILAFVHVPIYFVSSLFVGTFMRKKKPDVFIDPTAIRESYPETESVRVHVNSEPTIPLQQQGQNRAAEFF